MSQSRTRRCLIGGLIALGSLAFAGSADAQGTPACSSMATSFSSSATTGATSQASPSECYALDDVADGNVVAVRLLVRSGSTTLEWEIRDGDGNAICGDFYGQEQHSCTLRGTTGWTFVVGRHSGDDSSGTTSFAASVRRVDATTGCTALGTPSAWSFTSPRLNGTIGSVLGARCYSFERSATDPDESLWFRTGVTSGTLAPRWRLFGPSGALECSSQGLDYNQCVVRAGGAFTLVVDDAGAETGTFLLGLNRTSTRTGCTSVPSTGYSADAVSGSIGVSGEADCYELADVAGGARLRISVDRLEAHWVVVDGNGQPVCASRFMRQDDCSVSGRAGWALLIYNRDGATADYSFSARKLTGATGCTDLGPPTAWSFTRGQIDATVRDGLAPACFSFTRSAGSSDDSVWLRAVRTSGALMPAWRLYDPQGELVCSGTHDRYSPCGLRAFGAYTVVVEDYSALNGGSFYLTAHRGSAPTGCTPAPAASFAAAPMAGTVSWPGEVDCRTLDDVEAGDRVDVRVTGGYWDIVDGAGQTVCSGYVGRSECQIGGTAGWALLVYGDGTSPAFSYTAAVRRLNDADGCAAAGAPEVFSFTAPRITGLIDKAAQPRCYTFTRAAAEPDGAYLLRVLRSSGTIDPTWRVYDAQGDPACQAQNSTVCTLRGSGTQTIVVDDSAGVGTGGFTLAARRISQPDGCADIRSVAAGIPRIAGKLTAAGEIDCYRLPTSDGDRFAFTTTGSGERLSLYQPDGTLLCQSWSSFECAISGDDPVLALVDAESGSTTGTYSFEAQCANEPCGVTDTAIVDVTPNSIGAGSEATVLLRGRDLELLRSVRFVRGSTTLTGALEDAAPDGRTRRVQVNSGTAPIGAYDLEADFSDDSTRTLPSALTITSATPAQVRLDLVGRNVFRPGVPSTVVVQATNSGNVDARAVSVILGGLPEGSTLAPENGVTEVSGSADNPRLQTKEFDMGTGTVLTEQGIVAPFVIPRVPAGSSVQLRFTVTVPANANYDLRVVGGECLDRAVPGASPRGHARDSTSGEDCAYGLMTMAAAIGDTLLPGSACAELGRDVVLDAVYSAGTSAPLLTWGNAFSWGLGAAECAIEFTPFKFAGDMLDIAGAIWTGADAGYQCGEYLTESTLGQQAVASFDPNDLIGPAGAGEGRYITGEGDQLYQVLFENLPAATAPVQRAVIVDDLDTSTFDPASVRFRSVDFGGTVLSMPTPVSEIDEMVDLRPQQQLLVHVTAKVSAGQVRWEMQAIDPETLAPPEDPLVGFLPPNDATHRGEGALSYTVRLKNLPEGTKVSNRSSIVFDANEAIDTPTWSNIIDRSPPAVTLSAQGTDDPAKATVAWGGSDAASGVARWDIVVSKDGAPPTVWRTERDPGTAVFTAAQSGTYTFRATAHDGATNMTQSVKSAVTLVVGGSGGGGGGGGTSGGGGGTDTPGGGSDSASPLQPVADLLGVPVDVLKRVRLPRNAGYAYVPATGAKIKRLRARTALPLVLALDRGRKVGFAVTWKRKHGRARKFAVKPVRMAKGVTLVRLRVPAAVRKGARSGALTLRPAIGRSRGKAIKIRVG